MPFEIINFAPFARIVVKWEYLSDFNACFVLFRALKSP